MFFRVKEKYEFFIECVCVYFFIYRFKGEREGVGKELGLIFYYSFEGKDGTEDIEKGFDFSFSFVYFLN